MFQADYIQDLGAGVQGLVGLYKYNDQYIAIKTVLPFNKYISDGAVKELQALTQLKCSHIVQVLDVKIDVRDYSVKIAMPVYDGNLTKLFKKLEYISLIDQLILGLSHLHENNIIHRDIKPENILFNYEPFSVFLADFGQSIQVANADELINSDIYYAPYYRAPELLFEDDVLTANYNYKTDIWALGIVLIEYLTGDLITEVDTFDEIKPKIESLTINGHIDFDNVTIQNMLYIDYNLRSINLINDCKNDVILTKGKSKLGLKLFYNLADYIIITCESLNLNVAHAILALDLFERYTAKFSTNRYSETAAACISLVNKALDFDIINYKDLTDRFRINEYRFMEGLIFKNMDYAIINDKAYELVEYITNYDILRRTYQSMAKQEVLDVDILAYVFELLQND